MRGLLCLLTVLLAGCGERPATPPAPQVVRAAPLQAAPAGAVHEFSGDIRARHESRLAFRVGGKIIERRVDLGARVVRGQVLARLDGEDLTLAARAAEARAQAAQTTLEEARANLRRFTALRDKNFISAAELDRHRSLEAAAAAALEAARSDAAFSRNQLDYTTLKADADGVVTALDAEAGQVVAAGMPVMALARSGAREVLIFVPEDKLALMRGQPSVTVSLWAAPDARWPGTVREIAAAADPLTRTYATRISLPDEAPLQLGMSATVRVSAGAGEPVLRVPLSALLRDASGTAVWRVDPAQQTVSRQPVALGPTRDNEVLILSGVRAGDVVVTAGVQHLHHGQRVRVQSAP